MKIPNKWLEPVNSSVGKRVKALAPAAREYFEERAGINEFDGEMERSAAEALALEQTQALYPAAAEEAPFPF